MDVILSENATKQLIRLPQKEQIKIRKKFTTLKENPYSGKRLSGELSGLFSLRVWPYRIVYEVNKKEKRIEVARIAHRQGAYK